MAKFEVGRGLDDYIAGLQRLDKCTDEMIGKAIYQGAKIVADNVRKNIQALPEMQSDKMQSKGVTKVQKKGLLDGFGISTKQVQDGFVHVKLGFDGYNAKVTKKYPKGQPNSMVARFTESGNSYHTKTPFIRPAVKSSKAEAEKAMELTIDETINNIM